MAFRLKTLRRNDEMTEQEYIDVTNKTCLNSVLHALLATICLEENQEYMEARRLLCKVRDEIDIAISPE